MKAGVSGPSGLVDRTCSRRGRSLLTSDRATRLERFTESSPKGSEEIISVVLSAFFPSSIAVTVEGESRIDARPVLTAGLGPGSRGF